MYRNNAALIRMIVSVTDHEIVSYVEEAMAESPTLMHRALVGDKRKAG